ncbi:MAG: hypothetical protein ACREP6_10610, partial [Candidatus Binataceae bacterium]
SRIIVDLRGDFVTPDELRKYQASTRLNLFKQIDQLAANSAPPAETPTAGGVKFVLLPNEDLRGFARRVTGNAQNWEIIAKDNGIRSPAGVTPFQTIWVRNTLLKHAPGAAQE